MRCIVLCLCAVFCSAGIAAAQDLLTFEEAVALALRHNPRIAVARNSAEIAGNNVHIGNAGLLPRVDLTGSAAYQNTDPPAGPESDMTMTNAELSASYTLFDGLGNVFRYKRLASEGRQGRLEARNQIESTLLSVSAAYYDAAAAFENLRIARRLLEISRDRMERARKRESFGQAGTIDVLAARVDFNSDTVTVVRAEFNWAEAKRNLNVLLDRDISTEFTIEPAITFSDIESLAAMREEALERNASYRSSIESLEQARLSRNITRSAYLPRLDLSASYGYNRTADNFDISIDDPMKNWDVRATLSLNLFDGFQRRIDSKNAAIQVRSQELLEKQARLELDQALAGAYESYRNSRIVLDLEQRNLEAAQLNFQRTRELYRLGQVTSTQFREAQLNLIRAETNVSTARYDAKLREIELLRITGALVRAVDEGFEG
ncbi:MAG TPA: TolC family protein [Patescibacteria group bacterium]|nr:TolC family protein [Patescibacteria group bacterium]